MERRYRPVHQSLLCAWLIFGASYLVAVKFGATWFERSNSLVVLFGAMGEYFLLQLQQEDLSKKFHGVGTFGGPVIDNVNSPGRHRKLALFTHVTVMVSTFFWGFGVYFVP